LTLRLSPSAAKLPELVPALSDSRELTRVIDEAPLPAMLNDLHDDVAARAAYAREKPGVSVWWTAGKLVLVGRFQTWAQGGEAPNPPPLAAIRLVTLEGLEPVQIAAVVALSADTMLGVEKLGRNGPEPSSPSARAALKRAASVIEDPRATDCAAPCAPWSWQTRWSLAMAYADAAWREGSRAKDETLLRQSERRARLAVSFVPKATHPLTRAVSERLLGAVLESLFDVTEDATLLNESLASSRRALEGFQGAEHRYDRAFTLENLQAGLRALAQRSAASEAIAEALKVSQQALVLLDESTPRLRVRALFGRARLFEAKWVRSGDLADLVEEARLLAVASGASDDPRVAHDIPLTLEHCATASELASEQNDVEGMKQAVARCERVLTGSNLPSYFEPDAHRAYGLSLMRLAASRDDVATLERAVKELETAIEAADRIEGRSAGAAARANYALSLRQLARYTSPEESLRKAVAVSTEALTLTSKESRPLQWAQIKRLQGSALLALGWSTRAHFQMKEAARLYQESRAAFADALTVFDRADSPKRWARLEEDTGAAFAREGEIGSPKARLFAQAIASYQRALSVNRRDVDSAAFARTQFGLGGAYLIWADQGSGRKEIVDAATRAAAAYRAALEIYEASGNVVAAANGKAHLAEALSILERMRRVENCESLALRVDAVRAYPRAQGLWGSVQADLDRYDPAKLDRQKCPNVHPSFWETKPKKAGGGRP
jgi:tetratricopeptide (TPR) repeat protein